jgi:bifunctional NMN adenylyltransferase/nudix hydrolase
MFETFKIGALKMSQELDFIVFICRCQPPNNAHFQIIKNALNEAKEVIIALGSYNTAVTIKNPFSFETRKQLILASFHPSIDQPRMHIIPVRDYMYNDTVWITSLQNKISEIIGNSKSVKLIGHFKDDTSYYLKFFPQWELIEQECIYSPSNGKRIDSTIIRNRLFEENDFKNCHINHLTNHIVSDFLALFMQTEQFKNLQNEYQYIQNYKKAWALAPYPPTFVTTDCIVVQSGHVLVVKRKVNPGKNLYALPGGFLNPSEHIIDGAIRELKEETKININKVILKKNVKDVHVFDHPNRSMRGRTITHAHLIVLDSGKLPEVKGADDAQEAKWLSFNDLAYEEINFFEDHFHMINFFIHKI